MRAPEPLTLRTFLRHPMAVKYVFFPMIPLIVFGTGAILFSFFRLQQTQTIYVTIHQKTISLSSVDKSRIASYDKLRMVTRKLKDLYAYQSAGWNQIRKFNQITTMALPYVRFSSYSINIDGTISVKAESLQQEYMEHFIKKILQKKYSISDPSLTTKQGQTHLALTIAPASTPAPLPSGSPGATVAVPPSSPSGVTTPGAPARAATTP